MKKVPLTKALEERAHILSLAGDPTRIRILCLMYSKQEACVSEIATSLDMSVAAVSHHLQLLKDSGFFTTRRFGTTICYILEKTPLIQKMRSLICDCE